MNVSDDPDFHHTIRTVVKRAEILDRLAQGPANKRDLRDDLGVSRSTVYKAVRELEELELVTQTGDEVRLALFGQLLFEQYRAFVETGADVDRQRTLLSELSVDAPVTTDLLVGADCVRAERHVPSRPLDYVEDLMLTADRAIGLGPVAFRRYVHLFHELLAAGELSSDFVIERRVVEHVRDEYNDRFAESLDMDHASVWETDESLPFGLVLTEGDREEVAVVVYDEGKPVGAITNDTPAALDWGRDVFEGYKANAARIGGDGS